MKEMNKCCLSTNHDPPPLSTATAVQAALRSTFSLHFPLPLSSLWQPDPVCSTTILSLKSDSYVVGYELKLVQHYRLPLPAAKPQRQLQQPADILCLGLKHPVDLTAHIRKWTIKLKY